MDGWMVMSSAICILTSTYIYKQSSPFLHDLTSFSQAAFRMLEVGFKNGFLTFKQASPPPKKNLEKECFQVSVLLRSLEAYMELNLASASLRSYSTLGEWLR